MTRSQPLAQLWPARSWKPAGAVCLAPGPPPLARLSQEVTDADGDVTFTDKLPLSSDSSSEEHSVQAPNSAKPTQTTLAPAAPAEAEEPTRDDTRVVMLADDGTIPMGSSNYAVLAVWNPRLASSETRQLLLDGEPVGAPRQTGSWQQSNVCRDEHRLQLARLDENGAQLDASAASTVYLLRPRVSR